MGGVAKFSPPDISGLQLWLNAEVELFTDAAMTVPAVNDADVVGGWADQSGNNNDHIQAVVAKKPLLKLAIVNGRRIVRTDGADDLVRYGGTVSTAVSGALFVVAKTAGAVAEGAFLSSADEAADQDYFNLRIEKPAATPYLEILTRKTSAYNSVYGDTGLLASTVYLFTLQSNDTAWTLRVNGTNQGLTIRHGANTGYWLGDIPNRDNVVIGALKRTVETGQIAADFCEVLLYDGTMASGDRDTIEAYLAARWGITLP